MRDFREDRNTRSHRWYRVFNEIPVLALVACGDPGDRTAVLSAAQAIASSGSSSVSARLYTLRLKKITLRVGSQ